MAAGMLALIPFAFTSDVVAQYGAFGLFEWGLALFVGAIGGALTRTLWAYALSRATPTRVAVFAALNPAVAVRLGAMFLDGPLSLRLILGLIRVIAGMLLASHEGFGARYSNLS